MGARGTGRNFLRKPTLMSVAARDNEMARKLQRFSVRPHEQGFRLQIEDQDGECIDIEASREQVQVITDELDELLAESEPEQGEADGGR